MQAPGGRFRDESLRLRPLGIVGLISSVVAIGSTCRLAIGSSAAGVPRHLRSRALASLAILALVSASAPHVAGTGPGSSLTLRGTLVAVVSDDFAHGRSKVEGYGLQTATGLTRLLGSSLGAAAGSTVEVSGVAEGRAIRVAQGGIRPLQSEPMTAASAPESMHIAVILFNFTNDTSQPYTPADARGALFDSPDSVAAFYREQSFGKLNSLTGTVYGWYTINAASDAGCNTDIWAQAAAAAAAGDGFSAASFTNVVSAFPSTNECPFAGLAMMPGTESWNNGAMINWVNAHELGHNLGLGHAASIWATAHTFPVPLSASFTYSDYGDPFDVMGRGSQPRWTSNAHMLELGWLAADDVATVTAGGEYTLAPLEQGTGHPKLIRIARRGSSGYFYLEYRQPFGTYFDAFDPADPVANGVTIRADAPPDMLAWGDDLILIDTTPGDDEFSNAPLAVGQEFADTADGVRLTTVSLGPDGATVRIDIGSIESEPPVIAGLAVTPASVTPGTPAAISAIATDGSGVAAAGARIDGRDWQTVGTTDGAFGETTEQLAGSVVVDSSEPPLSEGTHQACLIAVDRNWNVGSGADCATISVAGSKPISVLNSAPNVATTSGAPVMLSATLTMASGSALSGQTVWFIVDGWWDPVTTDANGIGVASITAPQSAGEYSVLVMFKGTDTLAASTIAVRLTVQGVVPGKASNVMAAAGSGSATVSWSAPTFDGGSVITRYTATASPGGSACTTSGATTCTVAGLRNGTAYRFTVTATNVFGTGPVSAATSPAVVPATGSITARIARTGIGGAASSRVPVTLTWSTGLPASTIRSWRLRVVDGHQHRVRPLPESAFVHRLAPSGLSRQTACPPDDNGRGRRTLVRDRGGHPHVSPGLLVPCHLDRIGLEEGLELVRLRWHPALRDRQEPDREDRRHRHLVRLGEHARPRPRPRRGLARRQAGGHDLALPADHRLSSDRLVVPVRHQRYPHPRRQGPGNPCLRRNRHPGGR